MLSSSQDTLSKLSKTTYPQKLFANDCVTLQVSLKKWHLMQNVIPIYMCVFRQAFCSQVAKLNPKPTKKVHSTQCAILHETFILSIRVSSPFNYKFQSFFKHLRKKKEKRKDGNSFCRDVVSDSFNKTSRDEDNIL